MPFGSPIDDADGAFRNRRGKAYRLSMTVCFTGHRKLPQNHEKKLRTLLMKETENRILSGASIFRTGGALGFDTLAALTVLRLKKKYPDIRLELILPCPTQTKYWEKKDILLYEKIKASATSFRYISPVYYNGVLQMRNRCLVDGSDVCIAYLCTSHGSGSAFTCAYALSKGVELVNLADSLPSMPLDEASDF